MPYVSRQARHALDSSFLAQTAWRCRAARVNASLIKVGVHSSRYHMTIA